MVGRGGRAGFLVLLLVSPAPAWAQSLTSPGCRKGRREGGEKAGKERESQSRGALPGTGDEGLTRLPGSGSVKAVQDGVSSSRPWGPCASFPPQLGGWGGVCALDLLGGPMPGDGLQGWSRDWVVGYARG